MFQDEVTVSIPTAGGSLSSTSGDASFVFSNGAFTQTVLLTYRHLLHDENTGSLQGIGHTYDLTAVYLDTGHLAQLVSGETYTVTVSYTDAEVGPASEDTLRLYGWDGEAWSQQGITSTVEVGENLLTAQVDHLSLFAVLWETHRAFLPVVLDNQQ